MKSLALVLVLVASPAYAQLPLLLPGDPAHAPGVACCAVCGRCDVSYGTYPRNSTEAAQQRRLAEVNRRNESRRMLPHPKDFTDEEKAKQKWTLATLLADNGRTEASVRWKRALIKDFPETITAKVAQDWLWSHGYD